jgi:hypothetical protein
MLLRMLLPKHPVNRDTIAGMREVGPTGGARFVMLCALMWVSSYGHAFSDGSPVPRVSAAPVGMGASYLFGLVGGLFVFGMSLALNLRKGHLAERTK